MKAATGPEAAARQSDDFASSVLDGLSRPQKSIPCRFFYDERGSALFEAITRLPEYYPTRIETCLIEAHAAEISRLAGPHRCLVEFGSGSSRKTAPLIAAMDRPTAYAPIDVCAEALEEACARLAAQFPALPIAPVCADFNAPLQLPKALRAGRKLGFFPGSTIGNLHPPEAAAFLRRAAALLGSDGALVVGVDLRKAPDILIPAYDDAAGVTAAFNLNLLVRMNRELGADFDLSRFAHEAIYDEPAGRIEMRLRSLAAQSVRILGRTFHFQRDERIHTENSYKYGLGDFRDLAFGSGWRPLRSWTDDTALFSLHYLSAA